MEGYFGNYDTDSKFIICVIHESSIESFVDKFYMVSVFNNDFVVPNFFFVLIDLRASQIYELDEDDLHGCTCTYQYHESCHNFSFIFLGFVFTLAVFYYLFGLLLNADTLKKSSNPSLKKPELSLHHFEW